MINDQGAILRSSFFIIPYHKRLQPLIMSGVPLNHLTCVWCQCLVVMTTESRKKGCGKRK